MVDTGLKNLIPLVAFLVSCSASPVVTPSEIPSDQPTKMAIQQTATLPPATESVFVITAPVPATAIPSGIPLVFNLIYPVDNAVVTQPQIDLFGNVSREAVMTVNNNVYVLSPGDFSIPMTLDEGPNALEIVASDTDGNEIDLILTVTYQP